MSPLTLGVISGTIFGAVSAATMIPLKMENKQQAMIGAFFHRFGIGFVICNASLPWSGWINGLFLGLLLSLPDAIITKAYVPIMVLGGIGGAVVGYCVS